MSGVRGWTGRWSRVSIFWKCENCRYVTRSTNEATRHGNETGHAMKRGDERV